MGATYSCKDACDSSKEPNAPTSFSAEADQVPSTFCAATTEQVQWDDEGDQSDPTQMSEDAVKPRASIKGDCASEGVLDAPQSQTTAEEQEEDVAPVAATCTLTKADNEVGDHVCPVLGSSAVGYFESSDKLTKLFEASGEDLGRSFSLDGSSITATKERSTGGFACAVSDPCATDCPLVFVSPGFEDLTGYSGDFAAGRSCRFLQPTSKLLNDAVNLEERKLMREFSSFVQPAGTIIINLLLNQRFTGERFWNLLRMQHVVVDGDCYIFAVQTNLDAYMPKALEKSFRSQAKNTEIVKEMGPFIHALENMRKELRTMVSSPMMELKGYYTASMNYLQLLPLIAASGQTLEKPIAAIGSAKKDDEPLVFNAGQQVEVQKTMRYPTTAIAKGSTGTMKSLDAFGNIVVDWEDPKDLGTKSVLKRDVQHLKAKKGTEVVTDGFHPNWQKLYNVIADTKGADAADGIAGSHSQEAREEIVLKLITNHRAVINDLTNPSKDQNIEGRALTQTYLTRIEVGSKPSVDQMLREVARRLLGRRRGLASYVETPDKKNSSQCLAWRGTAIYLAGRIQSKPVQMPGRKPDMSEDAAAAFLAVLKEVATLACQNDAEVQSLSTSMAESQKFLEAEIRWRKLSSVLAVPDGSDKADGIAGSHAKEAREEGARAIITNYRAVVNDITNPLKKQNIEGKPLTQTYLTRVDVGSKLFVDQMLREVARRLLGRCPGLKEVIEERPDKKNSAQCSAWRGTATYMAGRIHSKPSQMPGRKPDMSEKAAAAFLAVMKEVGTLTCGNENEAKALSKAMADAQKYLEADVASRRDAR